MGKIEIEYSRAIAQANKLSNTASDLRRMLRVQYNSAVETVASSWSGESARAYLQKLEIVKTKLEKSIKALENLSSSIKKTAKTVLEAERKAAELARKRTHGGGGGGGR